MSDGGSQGAGLWPSGHVPPALALSGNAIPPLYFYELPPTPPPTTFSMGRVPIPTLYSAGGVAGPSPVMPDSLYILAAFASQQRAGFSPAPVPLSNTTANCGFGWPTMPGLSSLPLPSLPTSLYTSTSVPPMLTPLPSPGGAALAESVQSVAGVAQARGLRPRPYQARTVMSLPVRDGDQTRRIGCTFKDCSARFKKVSHFKSHLRSHNGEKPFECARPECGIRFCRSDELLRHTRAHDGHRPHVCATCARGFLRSEHLRKHLQLHAPALTARAEP